MKPPGSKRAKRFSTPTQTCEGLSVLGQFSDVPALMPVAEVFVLCRQRRPSHACPQEDLGPSTEVMIQAEVNDWVHAAVEEGQAARDQQPVPSPRRPHPPITSVRSQEL